MQNRWLGIDRPQQHGGIAYVDPLKRQQQWLQGRRGNDLGGCLRVRKAFLLRMGKP